MPVNKILIVLLISSLSFSFYQCSDAPSSIGADLLSPDIIDVLKLNSFTDSIAQSSLILPPTAIKLSSAERLLLGRKNDIEASLLIRFFISLPDSIKQDILSNSLNITSAYIKMIKTYTCGDETAPFDFTAHKINSVWSLDFTADSLTPAFSYEPNDVIISKELSDSINIFFIDNQLALFMLQAAADTNNPDDNGIILKPTGNAEKVVGFQALTSSFINYPELKVVIEESGVVDTLDLISTIDLSVVSGNLPTVFENILVAAGYAINSRLAFDLSKLPQNVVINNAELTLTIDTTETIAGDFYINSLAAGFLADSLDADSIIGTITLPRSGNTFSGSITSFVQSWVSIYDNQGILLRTSDQLNGVERFALKGSNTADAVLRPLLKITYTLKK